MASKSSYFGLYLVVALRNGVLKWLQTWIGMFIKTVSSDITCSVKDVDQRNKKNNNDNNAKQKTPRVPKR